MIVRSSSSTSLLGRILEEPDLPALVGRLRPVALLRVIDRVGLEDAGEIIPLASTEQLEHVFDEDLWTSERAGEDERFDADRFRLWLEVMLAAGDSFVASRLAELPEELVSLGVHRLVHVIRIDELLAELQDGDQDEMERTEKALEDCPYEEIDAYQVMARQHDGWDTVLSALLALDRDHRDVLDRILARCARMTSGCIEESAGLHELLSGEDMLEADVAGEREDRRAEAGHVAPSSAAASSPWRGRTPIQTSATCSYVGISAGCRGAQ